MAFFKKINIFILLGLFLLTVPLLAFAGSDKTIYIGPDEIVEGNFIRIGSIININGPVNGDIVVAGDSIEINGPVAGDVIAIGSTVKITGDVEGSVRVIGATIIEITKEVEKNIWAIGTTVSIGQDSNVGWDVYAVGADISIKGTVGGGVKLAGENILLGSEIKNNSIINTESGGTSQVLLLPSAKLLGDLTLKGLNKKQLVMEEGAEIIGETNFQEYKSSDKNVGLIGFNFFFLMILFSLLIFGLIFVTFLPKYISQINEIMFTKPIQSIGWGFVLLIFTPVVAVLFAITVVGVPLAIILLLIYSIIFFTSLTFAGIALGFWILSLLSKEKKYKGSLIWALALGLVLLMILISLPYVGWVIKLLAMVWTVGALMKVKLDIIKNFR